MSKISFHVISKLNYLGNPRQKKPPTLPIQIWRTPEEKNIEYDVEIMLGSSPPQRYNDKSQVHWFIRFIGDKSIHKQ